jgi:hypothetical protein
VIILEAPPEQRFVRLGAATGVGCVEAGGTTPAARQRAEALAKLSAYLSRDPWGHGNAILNLSCNEGASGSCAQAVLCSGIAIRLE